MVDIHIRVDNASDERLSGVIYRLMRGTDLSRVILNEDSSCFFFIDMQHGDFDDVLIRCRFDCD